MERLLSLLPLEERAAFIRTHPIAPLPTPILQLETTADFLDLPDVEQLQYLSTRRHGPGISSPKSQIVRPSSARLDEVQKKKLLSDAYFHKTISQLARE